MKIKLHNVRLAFPQLFVAKQVNGEGEPAFSASLIMSPKHPCVAEIRKGIEFVGKEKWGPKWPLVKKELESKDRTPLHDGDGKQDYAGFPGNLFISARNKTRPLVIDTDKSPLTQQDGRPYAGCYVVGNIELWPQDNKFGRRINASLRGVQFLKDGEAFAGGTPASEEEFDDLSNQGDEEGEDASDLA